MKTLLCLCVLAVMLAAVCGLSCYSCEDKDIVGRDARACDDTFAPDKDLLIKCNKTAGENFCRKEKVGVNHVFTEITRGCTSMCEEQNVAYVTRVTCCQTDECNTGYVTSASALTLGIMGLLFFAL